MTILIIICCVIPVAYFAYSWNYHQKQLKAGKQDTYAWYALAFVTGFFLLLATGIYLQLKGYW